MEAFFVSPGIAALSEIGDKTPPHSFILAAKFGKTVLAKYNIFLTALIAFFLAQKGEETVALAAQYNTFISIVAGTTIGVVLANIHAVYLGGRIADRIPAVHVIAAVLFAILGIGTLLGAGNGVGL